MNCLLVAATVKEIEPFLDYYRTTEKNWSTDLSIDVLITGIGLTATTYHLTKHFIIKKPDIVLQAGIAGCFDKKIALGSVVFIRQDTIGDEGVVELKKLRTLFDLQVVSQNQFPYNKGWLINQGNALIKKSKLKAVKGISVNQVTTGKQIIQFYEDKFAPATESMEGAAFHYVCLMEKIPFLQLRSISNYIGERNKKNWKMKEAIINLNKELIRLIQNI